MTRIKPFAVALLFAVMLPLPGFAARGKADFTMFVTLGIVFYVAVKFGRPLVAAVAVALACIALMTLHPPLWTLVALHAILFAEINNGLQVINVDPLYQNIFIGVILVAAVAIDQYRRKRRYRT